MDKRLEYVISTKGYNLSAETIKVVEEYLAQNPEVSKEKLLESFEWIAKGSRHLSNKKPGSCEPGEV